MVSFKGLIEQGKRTGQGVMKFSCGTIYDGGHENDKFHGKATITLPNGETYEAEYKQGWLLSDSMSTYTFRDGSVLKGYPAGNTMYDRIVCLPDILRERRSKYTIHTEAQRASAAAQAQEEEEDPEPEEQDEPEDSVSDPTKCIECDRELTAYYFVCGVCSKDYCCTKLCSDRHWESHTCSVQEDTDCEFWRFRKAVETPYDKAERERVCRKNAESEDEGGRTVPLPRKCVNINYPNRCVNCSGALKSDFFLCTVCNKDFFCTVECFNQHWASHPCNDEK
jgi:hypothetical protein